MQSAVASGPASLPQSAALGVAAIQSTHGNAQWQSFFKLVVSDYSYSTMHGVHIENGRIVACEAIQRSFAFGLKETPAETPEPAFDSHWKALESLCVTLGSGRLAELRFSRGLPVSARTSEGGRRFKRLLSREGAKLSRAVPLS